MNSKYVYNVDRMVLIILHEVYNEILLTLVSKTKVWVIEMFWN